MATPNIADKQLEKLNSDFFTAINPAEYFKGRLRVLALLNDESADLTDRLAKERGPLPEVAENPIDDTFLAIEIRNLIHHIEECLMRVFAVLSRHVDCPQLALAQLVFREFKTEVANFRSMTQHGLCQP